MRKFNRVALIVNLMLTPSFVYMQNWTWSAFCFCVFIWCCVDSVVYAVEDKR